MRSLPTLLALVLLLSSALRPSTALACACCAEPGTWYQRADKVSDYERNELERIKLAGTAALYMTAAGAEGVKGSSLPEASLEQPFNLALTRNKQKWTLVFKDHAGERGALVLTLPAKVTAYGVDLREGGKEHQGETVLYKEWRLEGHVWGNGFFSRGVTPDLKFRLILQGQGNNCVSADDFKHWQLQVWGPKARFAFYGELEAPAAAK